MGQNRVQGISIEEFWDSRVEEAPLCQLNGRSPSSGRLLRLFGGETAAPNKSYSGTFIYSCISATTIHQLPESHLHIDSSSSFFST